MLKQLTISRANFLYLVSLLLVITLGSWMQSLSFTWGLIGTEIFCILLPALLFMRSRKLPLRASLRLTLPDWKMVVVCLILGSGAWMVASFLEAVFASILGYVPADAGAMLPKDSLQAGLLFLGFAIAAPICEEILFRGAIQGAYEAYRPRFAVVMVSLIFAFYHLRLTGLIPLLPVAFILCYVVWRSQSVVAGMVTHFANNSLAALVMISAGLTPGALLPVPSLPAAGLGLLMILGGMILLKRMTPNAPEQPAVELAPADRPRGLKTYGALLLALAVYAGFVTFASREALIITKIEPAAKDPVAYADFRPTAPEQFTYQVYNRSEELVGQWICTMTPAGEEIQAECTLDQKAYQIQMGQSFFANGDENAALSARWSAADWRLLELTDAHTRNGGGGYSVQAVREGDLLKTAVQTGELVQALDIPADALLPFEAGLRLRYAVLESGKNYLANAYEPLMYQEATQQNVPQLLPSVLKVNGKEKLSTALGVVETWRVTLNRDVYWIETQSPYRLLQIDNGMEFYRLQP